jgi:hypothetical protein
VPIATKLWWNDLNGTHARTISARFGLIWFSGFRGEDLNVIFYKNVPNLHNQYKSAERSFSQENPEYMLNYSLSCSWPPSKIVFNQDGRQAKNRKKGDEILIVHCCSSISQNELKF